MLVWGPALVFVSIGKFQHPDLDTLKILMEYLQVSLKLVKLLPWYMNTGAIL